MTSPEDPTAQDPYVSNEAVLAEQVKHLQQTIKAQAASDEEMRKTTAVVATDTTRIEKAVDTHRMWFIAGAVVVAAVLFVAVVALVLAINARSDLREDDGLIAQLRQQQGLQAGDIHDGCRLYEGLYRFYNVAARDIFGDGPVAYDAVYIRFQQGADRLNCQLKHVVPGT